MWWKFSNTITSNCVDKAVTYDKCIVTYRTSNAIQESHVINVEMEIEVGGVHNMIEIDQGDQMTIQVD